MNNNTVGLLVGLGLSVGMADMAQAAPLIEVVQLEQAASADTGPIYMTADMLEYGISLLAPQA